MKTMKKIYFQPNITEVKVNSELPLALSNEVDGNSINFNSSTMSDGDGEDAAVKQDVYSVWDDQWEIRDITSSD